MASYEDIKREQEIEEITISLLQDGRSEPEIERILIYNSDILTPKDFYRRTYEKKHKETGNGCT